METQTETRKVLVLDRQGEFSTALARAAAGIDPAPEILRLRRPARVVDIVQDNEVDVIVAGPDELSPTGLRRLAQVHRAHPKVVILLSPNGRPVNFQDAARCGVSDVLPVGSGRARIRSTLSRALATAATLRQERVVMREAPAPEPVHAAPVKLGTVLTVASATGGCGKTFFATNIAGYLAKATGARVLLVDLDLQFGEVSVSLRLRPDRTIAELFEDESSPLPARLAETIVRHEAGYDVLCAPKDPVSAEKVGPREATAVIEAARAAYDYVVVDTPPSLNEVVLAAFDLSGALTVLATMDVPSLKNLNVFLQTLDRLRVPADDVSLILNKAEEGTGIELAQVVKLFPQGFIAVLPYAREVSRSINVGMPVIFSEPASEISRKLVDGCRKLVPPAAGSQMPWAPQPERRRASFFSRFAKKGAFA